MAYIDQSAAFGYGTDLTSTQMQNLRDNTHFNISAEAGGRILRVANLHIMSGTGAGISLKLELTSRFNGDSGSTDVLEPDTAQDGFALSIGRGIVTIQSSILTGNCVGIISCDIAKNSSDYNIAVDAYADSNDIVLFFSNPPSSDAETPIDSWLVDPELLDLNICYLTDA